MQQTDRLDLQKPETSDGVTGLRLAIAQNADKTDKAAIYDQGTIDQRPGAGNIGRRWYATDIGLEFVDTGAGWAPVGVPIGGVIDFAGAADPCPELVLADGRAIIAANYPAYNAIVGNRYGAGGAGEIRVPDLRGRVAVGPDNMGTARGEAARLSADDALGAAAGAEKHQLTGAESGVNGNGSTKNDGAHHHDVNTFNPHNRYGLTTNQIANASDWDGNGGGRVPNGGQNGNHAHGLNARNADQAHNNMQPYVVVNKLVRVK